MRNTILKGMQAYYYRCRIWVSHRHTSILTSTALIVIYPSVGPATDVLYAIFCVWCPTRTDRLFSEIH